MVACAKMQVGHESSKATARVKRLTEVSRTRHAAVLIVAQLVPPAGLETSQVRDACRAFAAAVPRNQVVAQNVPLDVSNGYSATEMAHSQSYIVFTLRHIVQAREALAHRYEAPKVLEHACVTALCLRGESNSPLKRFVFVFLSLQLEE